MQLFDVRQRRLAQAISRLSYCNPFLPERIDLERVALGKQFVADQRVWSFHSDDQAERANIRHLIRSTEELVRTLRDRLVKGAKASETDLCLYEDCVLYALYHGIRGELNDYVEGVTAGTGGDQAGKVWQSFHEEFRHFMQLPEMTLPSRLDPSHMLACFFQIRRAFNHIFRCIIGKSRPSTQLRAAVWQSIFTHDMKRYRRALFRHMDDIATLITGPSGTGKELVGRAIGLSRYIPFDARQGQFKVSFSDSFHALSIAALSPSVVESELFGHRKGAFTGATNDRAGWLELGQRWHAVFLDEIGELNLAVQVKLLRVLQDRTFQRLGDTQDRRFEGKLITATNRVLADEIAKIRFRDDLYYRLCADVVVTPSLLEQLADSPQDLDDLVLFISQRFIDDEDEATAVAGEVRVWIERNLGGDYAWPGNIRELEQCVRNIIIRQNYIPANVTPRSPDSAAVELADAMTHGRITADALLRRYCTMMYLKTGSYEQTARMLQIDRRTVKAKVGKKAEGRRAKNEA